MKKRKIVFAEPGNSVKKREVITVQIGDDEEIVVYDDTEENWEQIGRRVAVYLQDKSIWKVIVERTEARHARPNLKLVKK